MSDDDQPINVYLVLVGQGPLRRFEEVDAPDIETAAAISDGIVVSLRGRRARPSDR